MPKEKIPPASRKDLLILHKNRSNAYLNKFITQLVENDSLLNVDLYGWTNRFVGLAELASEKISPKGNAKDHNPMDVRNYVQVKVIAGGKTSECAFVVFLHYFF